VRTGSFSAVHPVFTGWLKCDGNLPLDNDAPIDALRFGVARLQRNWVTEHKVNLPELSDGKKGVSDAQ
jgi:hypothetical protein